MSPYDSGGGGSGGGLGPGLVTWFPLATHQLRVRSLSQAYLYHPTCQGGPSEEAGGGSGEEFYLSFHETPLSSPLYTSSPARILDKRVSWSELEIPQKEGGLKAVVVRIWSKTAANSSVSLSVQGIHFSGLVCIGDNLMMNLVHHLRPNSLVFRLSGHFFLDSESFRGENSGVARLRYIALPDCVSLPSKQSYGKTSLAKMQRTLRALKQSHLANERLKSDILSRGLDPSSRQDAAAVQAANSTSLRQQIFAKQLKLPATKRAEILLQQRIEAARLRLTLLREEKEWILTELARKKTMVDESVHEADKSTDEMTEKFHNLAKDKEKLSDWMQTFDEFRGYNEKARSELVTRRKQLISQLIEIFPINDPTSSLPTIGYVCLPEADGLKDREDNEVSVSLGWTAHLTLMISSLLTVPTRYQINHLGSRSCMVDYILDKIPEKERTFPLYPKGVERTRFEYAVYLLNKNIAQLRWHCEESTPDLRTTLRNLDHLLTLLTAARQSSSLLASPSIRLNLPHAPPVLSGVASPLCRGTPPSASSSAARLLPPEASGKESSASSSDSTDTEQTGGNSGGLASDQTSTADSSEDVSSSCERDEGTGHSPVKAGREAGPVEELFNETNVVNDTASETKEESDNGDDRNLELGGNHFPDCESSSLVQGTSQLQDPSQLHGCQPSSSRPPVSDSPTGSVENSSHLQASLRSPPSSSPSLKRPTETRQQQFSQPVSNGCGGGATAAADALEGSSSIPHYDGGGHIPSHDESPDDGGRRHPHLPAQRSVEVAVAADKFWDSVTSRAQVLSVPASFKTSKQKSFRQF